MKTAVSPSGLLLCLLMFAFSCRTPTYIPNTVNVPMFREPGELQASGYAGLDHVEVQGGYALDSSHGLALNAYWAYPDNDSTPYRISDIRAFFIEGGYVHYGQLKNNNQFEFLAGYGYGMKDYRNHYAYGGYGMFFTYAITEKIYDFSVRYHRLFAQANLGHFINNGKNNVFIAVSLRTSWMLYAIYRYNFTSYNLSQSYFIPSESDTAQLKWKGIVSIDPVITARIRTGPLYAVFQTGVSWPAFGHAAMLRQQEIYSIYLGCGISYIFNSQRNTDK